MSIHIVPLTRKHLDDAAALVSSRYRAARETEPLLPPHLGETGVVRSKLKEVIGKVPGVAAVHGGRLAGFLTGFTIPLYGSVRSAYSPEWAHGAELEGCGKIYQEMYARLLPRWVEDNCRTHLITLMAHHREALDAWISMAFGKHFVDALRDFSPPDDDPGGLDFRRAGLDDFDKLVEMESALHRHLTASPTFLPFVESDESERRGSLEERLSNPSKVIWLACLEGEPIAYISLEANYKNASFAIQDDKTISINGAFTEIESRNKGVATSLLRRSLEWARSEGYHRCAVDFESVNVLAHRFWLRHFRPVCFTLMRTLLESDRDRP